jgi:outer membrane protein
MPSDELGGQWGHELTITLKETLFMGGNMMKKIALVCAIVMALAASAMAAGGKTGYVDTQAVFDKTKLGKKYQGVVREYYESRKKILDMDASEIQKQQDEYNKQKQAKMLNEKALKEKEETINRKINEFQKKREEFSAEISKKNEELSNEFNQKMMAVLKDLAKKEKISLVLNKTINVLSKAEVPSVLYADEDLDMTDKVVVELDKKE